jgi:quercetin dioxygenase-like cupin family protein
VELEVKRFDSPDERRTFDRGRFEVLSLGGVTVGLASYEPGWKWSEHVGLQAGSESCRVEHVCLVLSGRAKIAMDDGTMREVGAGDLFHVGPGHDSWVVGEEPYVSLHFLGTDEYAVVDE